LRAAPFAANLKVRLQKFLAAAGVASRRAGEQFILDRRVAVNGQVIDELGTKVDPLHDRITVDGKQLKAKRKLYIALHKPMGYICSRQDPERRKTLSALLPKEWTNLQSVGRLDFNSEGLIFLTNDGDFSLRLTHPRYGVRKRYRVVVAGKVDPGMVPRMMHGVFQNGEKLKADKIRILSSNSSRSVVEMELTEGKYREVRRLFESQGITVERLQRTQIGPIKLGELPVGKWRALTDSEINSLLAPKL
jgi:23S rRNA pseudouridine2605 synthase